LKGANILITTFGLTWQVVPELLGFTNPGLVNLYGHHPRRAEIDTARRVALIQPADEVWCITTQGSGTESALANLYKWWDALAGRQNLPRLRIWQAAGIGDLASEADCRRMAECIYRLVLHASERVDGGQLTISLTGGRKTMSSDIQNAAVVFGCHALVHVIQNETYAQILRGLGPEDFSLPLPAELRDAVTPLVAGRYERNPVVDLAANGPITGDNFPVPFSDDSRAINIGPDRPDLVAEIRLRQENAGFLYCNYTHRLMHEESDTNFLALYNLPPAMIRQLKGHRVGVHPHKAQAELAWLHKLPKTELHCHLGGIADTADLIELAGANREAVEHHSESLCPWLDDWRRKLERGPIQRFDFKAMRKAVPGVPEPLCTAAFVLLFEAQPDLLAEMVFGPYRDESAFCGIGFDAYEALGDLQGSGLLQSEASLRAACRNLLRKAGEHHLKYLEVRCSPVNYVRGGLTAVQVARIIEEELSSTAGCTCSIIFIASRHGKMSKVHEHIELARSLMGLQGSGFPNFVGFDLAGNEEAGRPSEMRNAFMPMMEKCMHFTIHAGEIQDVNSIWEAVYHLNAERIGHGLTLQDNPDLLEKFRDRNIALEMCPSSNFQIIGFQDNYLPSTGHLPEYPLKGYLDKGLRVTVNTDNPGISRTDFTRELHRAARLTPEGLSAWDLLLLIRNGFKAAFCKRPVRQKLLREAEAEVLGLIQEGPTLWG
jgi:adenosine deaminase